MLRREFIAALGGAGGAGVLAFLPPNVQAQQRDRVRRVGVLMGAAATEADYQAYLTIFVQGLRQLGWIEGQNLRVDVRWDASDVGVSRIYAAQLIGLMPDVILVVSTIDLMVMRQATNSIPIVFLAVADPLTQGFIKSMNRPGGNITGFSLLEFSLGGKWIDLLKKVAPELTRVGLVFNPDTAPYSRFFMEAIEAVSPSLGVKMSALPIRTAAEIEPALNAFAQVPNSGLTVLTDSFTRPHFPQIADVARRLNLPSVSSGPNFARSGGLIDYGPRADLPAQVRQAAIYVDRLLKGSKPGDLPVQGVNRYTLAINLKTARTLGLEVPPGVIAIADEVID